MTVDDFLSGNFMQGSDDDAEDLEVCCLGLDLQPSDCQKNIGSDEESADDDGMDSDDGSFASVDDLESRNIRLRVLRATHFYS
jgi:hypothetical protein